MTATRDGVLAAPAPDDPGQVLQVARAATEQAQAGARAQLAAAAEWAAMHAPESETEAAYYVLPGSGHDGLAIAGQGAPLVAEFCIAELAAVLGMSTDAGRAFLGDAVELRHRLPRTWASVMAGRLPVWRARQIARSTLALPMAGAAFVDARLAPYAHKMTYAAIERLIDQALVEFDPAQAEAQRQDAAESRRFDIHLRETDESGTTSIEGRLDLADALDLEAAIATGAKQLADLGSTESLDVRRAKAAGLLARQQPTLDFDNPDGQGQGTDGEDQEQDAGPAGPVIRPRQLVIYAHLAAEAITGGTSGRTATVENTRSVITAEQVRRWCAEPGTQITVVPVRDLADHLATDTYTPTDRLREAQQLIDRTCVFPWCTRPARRCDCDHVDPWQDGDTGQPVGGRTCSCNLASLCRTHHRYKTHGGWRYDKLDAGTYLWVSPRGYRFLRTPDGGTVPLDPETRTSRGRVTASPPDR